MSKDLDEQDLAFLDRSRRMPLLVNYLEYGAWIKSVMVKVGEEDCPEIEETLS